MKKSKRKLSLNKLVISKLNSSTLINGGAHKIDIPANTNSDRNDCPTGTLTCETYYFSCKSCLSCDTNFHTENNC
ncbi:class I lanthipeptide [uncultured Dokdonia sp.]|uniref:class I lanthipeptide n=1 Tax=uncultured Dokdonia sp. TaxID=575653 RepID=UPI00344DE766